MARRSTNSSTLPLPALREEDIESTTDQLVDFVESLTDQLRSRQIGLEVYSSAIREALKSAGW